MGHLSVGRGKVSREIGELWEILKVFTEIMHIMGLHIPLKHNGWTNLKDFEMH